LRETASTSFDWVDWARICGSLVLVVALSRHSAIGLGLANRIAITAVNFSVAIPLLGLSAAALAPFREVIERQMEVPGLSETSAQILLAEIGTDMRRFPTAAHLLSWAGLIPRLVQSPPRS
jgi:hypothetical protein